MGLMVSQELSSKQWTTLGIYPLENRSKSRRMRKWPLWAQSAWFRCRWWNNVGTIVLIFIARTLVVPLGFNFLLFFFFFFAFFFIPSIFFLLSLSGTLVELILALFQRFRMLMDCHRLCVDCHWSRSSATAIATGMEMLKTNITFNESEIKVGSSFQSYCQSVWNLCTSKIVQV